MTNVTTKQKHKQREPEPTGPAESARILFVDLDGTLIQTDLLYEAVAALLKQSIVLLRALLKLVYGRAVFKENLSRLVTPEIRHLPFRQEVLAFVSDQHAIGRKAVLATATDAVWAQRVATELQIFDDVLASDGSKNLKGKAKLEAIRVYCREHGYTEFDYLGDSHADLPIWREARGVYIAAPSRRLLGRVRKFVEPAGIFGTRPSRLKAVLAVLRPHQWVKNLLVFVPLMTSHNVLQFSLAVSATIGFVCFCFCASAAYVLNDLTDLVADRRHPTKKKRPFAAGDLPVSWGLPLAAMLLVTAFVTSCLTLSAGFSVGLMVYFLTTCAYSFFGRRIELLDVLMLAGLYTIRVLAGGKATNIVVSEWLIAFSMFLFTSLAFAKRYTELERLLRASKEMASGRGYRVSDIGLIESMGTASGYVAVLVLALYVNGEQMKILYRDAWPLWLICAILMYWISRIWMKANRGELSEDPIVFALKDRISILLGIVVILLLIAASYL